MVGRQRQRLSMLAKSVSQLASYILYAYVNRHLTLTVFRQKVADLIGADKKEVIFTSGATECNNIAVKGVARFYKSRKKHIVTTQTV